jgi:uncharacterized protein
MRRNRKNGPIIDAHCHLGPPLLAEDLLKLMDADGVDQTIVFPSPSQWSMHAKENYYNSNDYIADMQAKYPERLIGFCCVNPRYNGDNTLGMPDLASQEVERCVKDLGLKGVKIHPEVHCFNFDALSAGKPLSSLMETLVRLQQETHSAIPLLSHGMTTLGSQPDQFGKVARDYPDVPIIIAHGAGYQNLYFGNSDALREHPNLYADTSMCTIDDNRLRSVARLAGVDKIIFGTDAFTRGHENIYGNFFFVLERAFPRPEDQELIFGGNISRILGLESGSRSRRGTSPGSGQREVERV